MACDTFELGSYSPTYSVQCHSSKLPTIHLLSEPQSHITETLLPRALRRNTTHTYISTPFSSLSTNHSLESLIAEISHVVPLSNISFPPTHFPFRPCKPYRVHPNWPMPPILTASRLVSSCALTSFAPFRTSVFFWTPNSSQTAHTGRANRSQRIPEIC